MKTQPCTVTRVSPISGEVNSITIEITQQQIDDWNEGKKKIQDIFPELSAGTREFILSGITPQEWDDFMKEPEEEESQ